MEDRVAGIEIANKLGRKPHTATKEDIKWFWKDLNLNGIDPREGPRLYQNSKEFVERNLKGLNDQYPFELTEWFMNWYRFMPDSLAGKVDGAGQLDWNIFFTLIGENPPTNSGTFWQVIANLNVAQRRIVRRQIYEEVANDPRLRERVLHGKPLPLIYTFYTPYGKIYKEVLRRIKPRREVAPSGSRAVFREVDKLMKEEGIDFSTALKEVEGNGT